MTTYSFVVRHGDTAIPVRVDNADTLEDAAIQAAAAAEQTMKDKPYIVTDAGVGTVYGAYTTKDIDEWWA